ncbi:MAG: peptidylprolyl isomerase [Ruminococcus sp.]|nr:peptidylprolyl isomerase [Ruminococcus sp.]
MRLRNAFMCAVLAAGMLLTGCSGKEAPHGAKLAEIEGFSGNISDVSPKQGDLIATFEIEDYGTIKAVLFPEAAPVGVENFQKLCEAGYYKDLTIHRVMTDFMLQGGSLNGNGTGGEAAVNGGSFGIETAEKARHFYGALCYANAGGINTTQFYIVNSRSPLDSQIEDYKANISLCDEYIKEYSGNADAIEYYRSLKDNFSTMVDKFNAFADDIKARYNEKGGTPSLDGDYTVFGQVYEGFDVIDSISAAEVTYNESNELSKPVKDIIITNVYVSEYVEG